MVTLAEHYQAFKNDRLNQLILNIRRFRAAQLREMLADGTEMDVQTFNQEIWVIGDAYLRNEKVDFYQLDREKDADKISELEDALQNRTLTYKGNAMWGSGTRVFGSMLKDDDDKIDLIQDALAILNEEAYNPAEKALQIQKIKGFGPNISTGLVMVFHPEQFMIYNEKSKEACRLIYGETDNLADFQQYMQQLKEDLHIEDFLELDFFLYSWLRNESGRSGNQMGFPFSNIFANEDEGQWAFDFIAEVMGKLGVNSSDDERLSMTYRRNMNGIHVNFCHWIILGVYRSGDLRIPLFRKYEGFQQIERIDSFAQKENEPEISGFRCSIDQLNNEIRVALDETLSHIAQRFEHYSRSPYRKFHLSSLSEAIFIREKRGQLFREGLQDHEWQQQRLAQEINYWIFQGNPNVFDPIGHLKEEGAKPWAVSAHRKKIKPDDKVIIWVTGAESGCYALGTVASEIYEDDNEDGKYKCDVEIALSLVDNPILKEEIEEEEALQDLKAGNQGTNFQSSKEEFEALMQLAQEKNQWHIQNPEYTLKDMQTDTGMDDTQVQRWLRSLNRKGQAILYGPPGTGKTYMAKKMAQHLIGGNDGFYDIVQFHPAYAYEDFIQGIRPVNRDGVLDYPLMDGRFLEFCQRASTKQGECVLIIDEINRANLSRVFGELMYLLEYREQKMPLAGGKELRIPQNVRIIGTMNTADRSIALMDHALRRRFAFLSLRPNYDILRNYHQKTNVDVESLISTLEAINRQIGDANFELGISFFLLENLDAELEGIWRMEIEPYLEEYFFDQPDKTEMFRWEQVKDRLQV
ncbi:AAA family ATPase [Salicibibacter halophilus]|nr:AAA family ATPase [Salicibibacter halophilus]